MADKASVVAAITTAKASVAAVTTKMAFLENVLDNAEPAAGTYSGNLAERQAARLTAIQTQKTAADALLATATTDVQAALDEANALA